MVLLVLTLSFLPIFGVWFFSSPATRNHLINELHLPLAPREPAKTGQTAGVCGSLYSEVPKAPRQEFLRALMTPCPAVCVPGEAWFEEGATLSPDREEQKFKPLPLC